MVVYFTKIKNKYSKTITLMISEIILVNSNKNTSLEEKELENSLHLIFEANFFYAGF